MESREGGVANESLDERIRSALESGTLELPVLPATALDVASLCSRDAEIEDIVSRLRADPSLVGRLLAAANSAANAASVSIDSVQLAVNRLGLERVRNMAFAIATRDSVFSANTAEIRDVYRHSAQTAYLAQELARRTRRGVEAAFVAGMLHDCGHTVFASVIEADDPDSTEAREQLHPEVGALVADSWGLGEAVVRAIRGHHSVAAVSEDHLAAIVCVSDRRARGLLAEGGDLVEAATGRLELYEPDLVWLDEQVEHAGSFAECLS